MSHALQPSAGAETGAAAIEAVLAQGDLGRLTNEQRVAYYQRLCESMGLNALTRPFEYLVLNNKLTLYARKDCTDQLRKINNVSIDPPRIDYQDEWVVVTVAARDASGRTDADIGVVHRKDMRGDFGNVVMKAVTKAKRRVTLSICGLGMLDETEAADIPGAEPFVPPQPPAVRPDVIAWWSEKARAAATLGDLRRLGKAIGEAIKAKNVTTAEGDELRQVFVGRRQEIEAAGKKPASPPAGEPEPTAEDIERDDYLGRLSAAAAKLGVPAQSLFERHSQQVGAFSSRQPLPPVAELTLVQLEHLVRLAEQSAEIAQRGKAGSGDLFDGDDLGALKR